MSLVTSEHTPLKTYCILEAGYLGHPKYELCPPKSRTGCSPWKLCLSALSNFVIELHFQNGRATAEVIAFQRWDSKERQINGTLMQITDYTSYMQALEYPKYQRSLSLINQLSFSLPRYCSGVFSLHSNLGPLLTNLAEWVNSSFLQRRDPESYCILPMSLHPLL